MDSHQTGCTQEIDCLCCKELVTLNELKFEGKLLYVIF